MRILCEVLGQFTPAAQGYKNMLIKGTSRLFVLLLTAVLMLQSALHAVDLAEKRANLAKEASAPADNQLKELNRQLSEKKKALLKLQIETDELYRAELAKNADQNAIDALLKERAGLIEKAKKEIAATEITWKEVAESLTVQEDDGLWHQPDTTIGQLVIDYGSTEHVYLMPPEIAALHVYVSSQLTIPKAAWTEMLELILASYGVGIKPLNTFMRQLFFLRMNQADPATICSSPDVLKSRPLNSRVCYIISPPPAELRRIYQFLEKFVPQEQMAFQVLGSNIVMVGYVREVLELMKLYDFALSPKQAQEYKIVALQKAQSEEVAQILLSIFEGVAPREAREGASSEKRFTYFPQDSSQVSGFRVIPLKHPAHSLFLMGKRDQIEKAAEIIAEVENRINEVQEKTIFWYPCKHSDAEELGKVISQVYLKMIAMPGQFAADREKFITKRSREKIVNFNRGDNGNVPPLIVTPPPVEAPGETMKKKQVDIHDDFIVDVKTNSIVMVVEAFVLDKLKELIYLLDVPKKMIQIDVLLVEKKMIDKNDFGLNLLRLGDYAKDKDKWGLGWNDNRRKGGKGILHYIISRANNHAMPAYDISFNFLLSQKDVQINANPSMVTVNQTPVKFAIVDEISINTGTYETDSRRSHLKSSYERAQYGITIQVTPTVHAKAEGEDDDGHSKFVTITTDINFDTPIENKDHRPDVTRRSIKNEVRIKDGETVILGGLRRKEAGENKEMIPFLGEIPGIGKLFSNTSLTDSSTEMFIFITPKVIPDATEEFREMRKAELMKRPGDIPEFLYEIEVAKKDMKRKLFEGGLKMLFGRDEPFYNTPQCQN